MSEDSQSTESLPPSAEQSDSAGGLGSGPANDNSNNNNNDSPPARSKSRNAAPATKIATPSDKPEKSEEAKTTDANGSIAQSQPMTVSNSTSSEMTSMTDAAAPYSTRSRGRRDGAPRPNYAEDVEMDFELTSPAPGTKSAANSTKRSTAVSSITGSPSAAVDSDKGPAASTRKGQSTAANATTNGTQANAAAKEPIPGTSTFSANATNNNNASSASSVSRKRKQPPSGATGTNSSGTAKRVSSSTSGYKHDFRLSSMMTFENSGARLRNGKLKADDGTTLEVNGKSHV